MSPNSTDPWPADVDPEAADAATSLVVLGHPHPPPSAPTPAPGWPQGNASIEAASTPAAHPGRWPSPHHRHHHHHHRYDNGPDRKFVEGDSGPRYHHHHSSALSRSPEREAYAYDRGSEGYASGAYKDEARRVDARDEGEAAVPALSLPRTPPSHRGPRKKMLMPPPPSLPSFPSSLLTHQQHHNHNHQQQHPHHHHHHHNHNKMHPIYSQQQQQQQQERGHPSHMPPIRPRSPPEQREGYCPAPAPLSPSPSSPQSLSAPSSSYPPYQAGPFHHHQHSRLPPPAVRPSNGPYFHQAGCPAAMPYPSPSIPPPQAPAAYGDVTPPPKASHSSSNPPSSISIPAEDPRAPFPPHQLDRTAYPQRPYGSSSDAPSYHSYSTERPSSRSPPQNGQYYPHPAGPAGWSHQAYRAPTYGPASEQGGYAPSQMDYSNGTGGRGREHSRSDSYGSSGSERGGAPAGEAVYGGDVRMSPQQQKLAPAGGPVGPNSNGNGSAPSNVAPARQPHLNWVPYSGTATEKRQIQPSSAAPPAPAPLQTGASRGAHGAPAPAPGLRPLSPSRSPTSVTTIAPGRPAPTIAAAMPPAVIPPASNATGSSSRKRKQGSRSNSVSAKEELDCDLPLPHVDLTGLSKEEQVLALKRMRNTEAARRSRAKKMARMDMLESVVDKLETENARLVVQLAILESEKTGWKTKQSEYVARIASLEHQLSESHQAIIQRGASASPPDCHGRNEE
ncbi:hypothetical protein HDU96_004556 [Phlyctochytrium bullatum]|nr:hypothetical protein HDU96_004556 [Phlyctochytrium bullatum]